MLFGLGTMLFVVSAAGAGCSPSGPVLEGFSAGGLAGYECPPASVGAGNCGGEDCGVPCVANTICDPAQAACPAGYECDASGDTAYCMPAKICESSAGCGGDYCATGYSKGICVPVDLTKIGTACDADNPCDWAFLCTNTGCQLFCNADQCPTGSTCVENRCSPMPG